MPTWENGSNDPEMREFWNVSLSVGLGGANTTADIMLVQYFLKRAYEHPLWYATPRGEMTVDGFCGPVTARWIRQFQTDLAKSKTRILPDGRVDRALPGDGPVGPYHEVSQSKYSIVHLNFLYKDMGSLEDLYRHDGVPPKLSAALLRAMIPTHGGGV